MLFILYFFTFSLFFKIPYIVIVLLTTLRKHLSQLTQEYLIVHQVIYFLIHCIVLHKFLRIRDPS